MKKIIIFFSALISLFAIHYSLFVDTVSAVCPICTIAVAGGLGLSRWLGVDDTISGVWIGGLILSSSLWLTNWLERKFLAARRIKYLSILVLSFTYLLILGPLAWADIIGHPFNRFWGIDKLIAGTAFGSLAFWAGTWADNKIRKIKGKQLFNYQKIVFPIVALVIVSLALSILVS